MDRKQHLDEINEKHDKYLSKQTEQISKHGTRNIFEGAGWK